MALDEPEKLEGVADILRDLGAWLETLGNAEFRMAAKKDIGHCVAADRRIKLDPLFGALGIREKVIYYY